MKKQRFKYLFLMIPCICLTGCGYSLKELYSGDSYNSVNFADNFYKVKEKTFVSARKLDEIKLDKDIDKVFTSYNDENYRNIESQYSSYVYSDREIDKVNEDNSISYKPDIGHALALSNEEKSFRYGYISKLFDGEMFCNGRFELARIQIDEEGFTTRFKKELSETENTYFAINFKSAIEFRRLLDDGSIQTVDISAHKCDIKLNISFFYQGENEIVEQPVSYEFDKGELSPINVNPREGHNTNCYTFFGFKVGYNLQSLERCIGIGISYELLHDSVLETLNNSEQFKNKPLKHSLLLYEVLMPYTTWH